MKTNDIIMTARMTDENTIAVGELYANGTFVEQYYAVKNQVDTEQKVLAWVYQLCMKRGIDGRTVQEVIECCKKMHPHLDVDKKD